MFFLFSLTVCILTFVSIVHSKDYPNPGPCSGECGNSHDPALIRHNGTYYRFATNGGIPVATAPSIRGPWTPKGRVLMSSKVQTKPAGPGGFWAPDVNKVGDTFYMLYAVSTTFGKRNSEIGYLTSKDLKNWQDHGTTGIVSNEKDNKRYNAIDGNLFQGLDKKYYIAFGSFWQDLFVAPTGFPLKAGGNGKQIALDPQPPNSIEAAFVFPHGQWHYLFYSWGSCCGFDKTPVPAGKEYRIKVCRSKDPMGGYQDKQGRNCAAGGGTVVLESHGSVYAPGGQGVYDDPELGPVLYYHYLPNGRDRSDGAKRFGWNKLKFEGGWPVVV